MVMGGLNAARDRIVQALRSAPTTVEHGMAVMPTGISTGVIRGTKSSVDFHKSPGFNKFAKSNWVGQGHWKEDTEPWAIGHTHPYGGPGAWMFEMSPSSSDYATVHIGQPRNATNLLIHPVEGITEDYGVSDPSELTRLAKNARGRFGGQYKGDWYDTENYLAPEDWIKSGMFNLLGPGGSQIKSWEEAVPIANRIIPAALERKGVLFSKNNGSTEDNAKIQNYLDYWMKNTGFAQGGLIKEGLSELLKLYHGGRKFSTWDPRMIGTGEGRFLAQGPGLYGGDTPVLGKVYTRYGGTSPTLSELVVDPQRIIDPAEKMTPEQRAIINEAESRLDRLGLKASNYGIRAAFLNGRPYDPEKVRSALVDSGLTGLRQYLNPDYGSEYVIYDPGIIKSIRHMDPTEYAQGGMVEGPLSLTYPKSQVRGPLNIGLNNSNMMAKARAGTPAAMRSR